MAFYDPLIAVWTTTVLPANTTGAALAVGDTPVQKIAKINAWITTGVIPTSISVSGSDVFNCINYPEFKALTAAQQTNLLMMLSIVGPKLGGSSNMTHLLVGMILDYFTNLSGPTIVALTALSKGAIQPWAVSNGYPAAQNGGGGLTLVDVADAGLN